MPQKEYEGEFILVVFAFLFEMPQNRRISISVLLLFESRIFERPHFHFARNISNAPFFPISKL